MENGALELQLGPELGGVGQIAVVGQGHAALDMVDQHGLGVAAAAGAGGAVAHVAHGHIALSQALEDRGGEHLAHETHVLEGLEEAVVIDHDAAALLPPVL